MYLVQKLTATLLEQLFRITYNLINFLIPCVVETNLETTDVIVCVLSAPLLLCFAACHCSDQLQKLYTVLMLTYTKLTLKPSYTHAIIQRWVIVKEAGMNNITTIESVKFLELLFLC